jgi:phosphoribosyl 1,2-cyclic phosphate phosphodiesterase
LSDLRRRFAYAFAPPQPGGGIPDWELQPLSPLEPFALQNLPGLSILPVTVYHGQQEILGFRFGTFAYLTDVSRIPEESLSALDGVEWLITSALRHRPHPTHMSVSEAVELVHRLRPRQAWFTHICHDLDHEETNRNLPDGMALLYDGQVIEA